MAGNRPPNHTDDMNQEESLLDEFELAWIAGEPVSIDEFLHRVAGRLDSGETPKESLTESPAIDPNGLLAELVRLEFEYRYQANPHSPPTIQEYVERFPKLRKHGIVEDLAEDARRLRDRISQPFSGQPFSGQLLSGDPPIDPLHTIVSPWSADFDSLSQSRFPASGNHLLSGEAVASPSPPSPLPPRFRREAVLGEGSFGVVHRAFDLQLQRPVAIKTLHPKLASDPQRRTALVDEARRVAQFDHPNLISVYDVIEADQCVHLVMKLVDGVPLDGWWTQSEPAPSSLDSNLDSKHDEYRVLASLMAQVSRAVHHAHLAGCIHCDLKPQNILVDRRGTPTVLDFGLSIRRNEQGALAGRIFGTPAYMSPEQTWGENHHLDGRSDIWSLGAILYRLLTGRLPFEADNTPAVLESIQTRVVTPPQQLRDQIPDKLSRICLRCLNKRIDGRYETAAQLASELQSYADEVISRSLASEGRPRSTSLKNCPFTETDLVGRDELIDSAVELLSQTNHRLLTLTGSGGIGKTQTAAAIAHRLVQRTKNTANDDSGTAAHSSTAQIASGDILWIDAANATTDDQLAAAVLAGLGVAQQPDEPSSQRVEQSISVRGPVMFVLDNLEQVIDEASRLIDRWLIVNPQLRLIVTSQLPLQIARERVIVLPPLSVADEDDFSDTSPTSPDQSSELFIRRALLVSPDLQVDIGPNNNPDNNAREVIRKIGVLLDGNPLAIELAASRVGILTLDDLLRRLTQSFAVLKSRRADRPDRHQSLTHVVRWSIDLLTESQTDSLQRLAVWPAPIPMLIAEELLEGNCDALEVLEELRQRSLLRFRTDGEVMVVHADNTIRRFLNDRISDTDRQRVAHSMARQLLDYVSSTACLEIDSPIDRQHLATNLSTAVSWFDQHELSSDLAVGAAVTADRLAADQLDSRLRIERISMVQPPDDSPLRWEWVFRLADARRLAGQTEQSETLCRDLLASDATESPQRRSGASGDVRVDTRKLLARILFRTGRGAEAIALLEVIAHATPHPSPSQVDAYVDPHHQLEAILELVEYERRIGHFDRAESWLSKGNAILDQIPRANVMRMGLMIQEGKLALQRGRIAQSRNWFEQALQSLMASTASSAGASRERIPPELMQQALLGRAATTAESGEFAAAELDYDRCERISRRLGDLPTLAQSLNNRALAADDSGDAARAYELVDQALAIYRGLGDRVGIAIGCCAQASARLSMGQPTLAIELLERDEVTHYLPQESIHQAIRHGDLGVAYREIGDLGAAQESLSQCLVELDRLEIGPSAERLIYQVAHLVVLDQLGEPDTCDRLSIQELVARWRGQPHPRQRVQRAIELFDQLTH